MKLIVEDYKYKADSVQPILKDIINEPRTQDSFVSVNYVGYCYNKNIDDCVFILPKVIIDEEGKVFGNHQPEDIIDIEKAYEEKVLTQEEHRFLYNLSVWIYRAICEYNRLNDKSEIVCQSCFSLLDISKKQTEGTLLDIILSLVQFNNENKDFFLFVIKNIHSGYNKINWNKTISTQQPLLQKGTPIYLNPVNKKKQINFDEELLVIFFSILQHINEKYGFSCNINYNYKLISGAAFDNYLKGFGTRRLRQIKYKYFSDKALQLWKLCYDFFAMTDNIQSSKQESDYLLVKSFHIVFESMIDELLGDKDVVKPLKENKDGKIIDHIYKYESVINPDPIYYIGDSKYYKLGHDADDYSKYKQYTYAKNVIQYNMDLYLNREEHLKYRDEVTEGYNVTPNFFISARIEKPFDYSDSRLEQRECYNISSRHFENRLFDRDTLWLAHYDINFLFVLSLYAGSNEYAKKVFREDTRDKFRKHTMKRIGDNYNFHVLKVKQGNNFQEIIDRYFRKLSGKIFCPYRNSSLILLALDKSEAFAQENQEILDFVDEHFYHDKYTLGTDPHLSISKQHVFYNIENRSYMAAESGNQTFEITSIDLEDCKDEIFLIGCFKNEEHLKWMHGDREKPIRYNIRHGHDRDGAVTTRMKGVNKASFLILYNFENEKDFAIYRITRHEVISQEDMIALNYPTPQSDYILYKLGEQVVIEGIDVAKILFHQRIDRKNKYIDGAPLFLEGWKI